MQFSRCSFYHLFPCVRLIRSHSTLCAEMKVKPLSIRQACDQSFDTDWWSSPPPPFPHIVSTLRTILNTCTIISLSGWLVALPFSTWKSVWRPVMLVVVAVEVRNFGALSFGLCNRFYFLERPVIELCAIVQSDIFDVCLGGNLGSDGSVFNGFSSVEIR